MKHFIISLLVLASTSVIAQECSINISRSAPDTRFVLNNEGSVKDQLTGLTWMRCRLGQTWNRVDKTCDGTPQGFYWQSALTTVETINDPNGNHALHQFSGIKQWRLPNIKELDSLTEVACYGPAMNTKTFASSFKQEVGDLSADLWSNTPAGNTVDPSDSADGKKIMTYSTMNGEIYPRLPGRYEFGVLLVGE
ncbi:DUF1566 domain-containing protein [Moritella viscosa]|uniref:Lcl C-terminal domain-containing protein n=1 Tax=Moritella viscosa TaxID=80854 RepID=A0ABY1H874_9GAMM|nr:DUF1566 domain-containing protein [Moritella viscosa]CED58981.1 putative exported protein [Moritella viscosa]SGY84638.1 Putative uncharacterized protein [Moritella viscosa]SGY85675.1 Putative uncharacterized protein [Moritella viscosa]SGY85735.1 Putative uncharacterized protein [Moritella viscosa]SGY86865.1 Putative uncharacterized protein [Moritella viscosa]